MSSGQVRKKKFLKPTSSKVVRRLKRREKRKETINDLQSTAIMSLQRQINKLDNSQEAKYRQIIHSLARVGYDVLSTTALYVVSQGSANNQRIGDEIRPTFISVKGVVTWPSGATFPLFVRITLVKSKQRFVPDTIATTGVNKIYENANSDLVPFSFFDHANREHFKIVQDFVVQVGNSGNANYKVPFSINVPVKGKIDFSPGATTTEAGQYYICMTSDRQEAAASNPPSVYFVARSFYKDA